METCWRFVLLCTLLSAEGRFVSATEPGVLERLLVATVQRPWLWGVYVFTVGLPIILFISFMWPDKRFGPPDQPYYYKKCDDDVQPDDVEVSPRSESLEIKGKRDSSTARRREIHGLQRKRDLEQKVQ